MKCRHCSREVKLWQTACPSCGARLQNKSYSTIADISVTGEQQSRRRLLRKTLQFALLAVTIIILASVIRLSPPQANPISKETLSVATRTSPSPVPTPEPTATATLVAPTPGADSVAKPTPEANLQPIDLFADVFDMPATTKPQAPRQRAATVTDNKAEPSLTVVDEVPPKKVTNPILASPPAIAETKPTPSAVEPEPNIELEAGQTLLQPNIGMITIKSYVPARVYIDGVYSGVTPRSVKLLAGEHRISLMAVGYHDYTRTVKVGGQQQLGILASMSKK